MYKQAKSSDPIQQHLRDHKKQFNIAVKEFIKRVIAFKKAINGRGDTSYGLPVSDIKNPIPSEISTFLNELAANFQQLSEEAVRIMQEQDSYSQHRKKPAEKIATAALTRARGFISINGNILPTLLALSPEEQEQGLMFEKPPTPIMTFIFNSPKVNKFWMKNCLAPLDIVFAKDNKILSIHTGEPFSTKLIGENKETSMVVELPYGTCAKLNIKPHDDIFLING